MYQDAIIVGGSFAGLSAGLMLARARRQVRVIDAGKPRNRFAAESHGFFSRDGAAPQAMLEQARRDLLAYPSARLIEDTVQHVQGADGAFELELASGEKLGAKKLVLAYGMRDQLPEIPGLAERWGATVLHCPYCHGYEFADRRLGVLALTPISAMMALLISEWGPTRLFLQGQPDPEPDNQRQLDARGVTIERTRVVELLGRSPVLEGVRLDDGRIIGLDALYIGPQARPNSALGEQLGCAFEAGPFGPYLRTDEFRLTSVPGVYAAGDIVRIPANATWAAADGVTAGTALHCAFVFGG